MKKLIIGCDHGGFNLKNKIVEHLKEKGYEIEDVGTYSTDSCDYPVIAKELARKISDGTYERGILVCGTGLGMGIVANKFHNVRAVTCFDTCSARMSRSHNDANVLCLGERITGEYLALDIVDIWLSSEFSGGRHQRRVDMFETDII